MKVKNTLQRQLVGIAIGFKDFTSFPPFFDDSAE
jgi:hypothetical protein